MEIAAVEQRLHQDGNAADLEQVLGDVAPAGLQVGDIGGALEHFGDVVQIELDPALMRDGRQVQAGIGRTAGGGDDHAGVFQRLAGDDVARTDVALDQLHHGAAGRFGIGVAALIGSRSAGRTGQRQAHRFGDAGHRVGGELAAAGSGRRTGDAFQLVQVLAAHLAGAVGADRLEHVLNGDVPALVPAGQDRAAIHEDAGHVEADHRHHHAGQRLVAAGQTDQTVVAVAAHRHFDRIGDHFAADQRRLHAGMAHGDAVGDGDGGELARRAATGLDAHLDGLGLAVERDIAGSRLVPAGRDADEGLRDLFLGHPHGVVIGAVRRPLGSNGDMPARQVGFVPSGGFVIAIGHDQLPPVAFWSAGGRTCCAGT